MRTRVLFSALLFAAQTASAALVVRPGPSAIGASAAAGAAIPAALSPAAVPQWTASFDAFLASPSPDARSVRDIAQLLAAARPDDPALKPFAQALRLSAAPLLARPVHAKSTQADLEAAELKFEVLNYPAVRALLSEEQQARAGAAAWALTRNVWTKDPDHWVTRKRAVAKTIAAVLRELEAERPSISDESAVVAGPDVAVEVLKGDIRDARADAVLTTVQRKRLCGGGVNAAIKEANGCFAAQLRKSPRLEDGRALLARGDGKGPIDNVLFVADKFEKPLSDIILEGLKAADRAGLKSLAVPALRTGSVFGAVERTYQEVVAEIRSGVRRFLAGARTSLERISFVVHNDEKLASRLQGAFDERERSLRTDVREARLSGKGFVLTPRKKTVAKRKSPVYGSLLEPWDLKHLLVPHKPVKIGEIEDRAAFSGPVTSVLNMPIKMPGTDIRVPEELSQFREFLQKIIDHETAVNPELEDFYMYLTVDQRSVQRGTTHRRPGIHIDGVQGARYKVKLPPEHLYSASDRLGTVFYDQPFDLTGLDPAKQHVHAELERQAKEATARATPDFDIAFWDSYSVHRADVAKEDFTRTFIRVEFSMKQYDSEGDTHNPLFEYDWKPVARPIPADLDDKPLAPGK